MPSEFSVQSSNFKVAFAVLDNAADNSNCISCCVASKWLSALRNDLRMTFNKLKDMQILNYTYNRAKALLIARGSKEALSRSEFPKFWSTSSVSVYRCWEQELRNSEEQKQTKEAGNGKANKGKGTPRLHRALVRAFWAEYCLPGAMFFVYCTVLCILQPIFQSWIISYFNVDTVTKRISKKDALIYAGCLTINVLASVFVFHQAELLVLQMGMKLRIACCSLVYKKVCEN